jgi:FtsP/CotA-like multicopper oxidase with cupredoxin domain
MGEKRSRRTLKEIANATKNRREIIAARLSRREMIRMGLLTSAGMLVPVRGLSARWRDPKHRAPLDDPESPPTTPFVEPLNTAMNGGMPIKVKETPNPNPNLAPVSFNPNPPTIAPNTAAGEGRTRNHQYPFDFPNTDFYKISQQPGFVSIHPDLDPQYIWGFDGISPGPTLVAQYGRRILMRNQNNLPAGPPPGGFGLNSVTTHLHNGHTPSESDGFPCDFYEIGQFYDHHYPNVLAGFASTHAPNGDPNETLSTLWFHDHRIDFTSQNVYKGLAAFYILFSAQDTGNENTGFHLPTFPDFDIPLMLADRIIDPDDGQLFFDLTNLDGIVGDKFLVNGKVQPFFDVKARRYRFRILNSGPSRFYNLFLTNPNNLNQQIPFYIISSDGNLLPNPLLKTSVVISVAERNDIIIDFKALKDMGISTVYLENRMEQDDGRGPDDDDPLPAGQGNKLLKFNIGETVTDNSVNPATNPSFYALPTITGPTAVPRITRTFRFERTNGMWAVNGKFVGVCSDPSRFKVQKNSVEKWIIQNNSGGWEHPIHIHFEELRMLKRNGVAIPSNSFEFGRKDVVRLGRNQTIELFFRFRDFEGRYPIHCHNVVHEDHAMMVLWEIAQTGDNKTQP